MKKARSALKQNGPSRFYYPTSLPGLEHHPEAPVAEPLAHDQVLAVDERPIRGSKLVERSVCGCWLGHSAIGHDAREHRVDQQHLRDGHATMAAALGAIFGEEQSQPGASPAALAVALDQADDLGT